jgi:hypothetical protein
MITGLLDMKILFTPSSWMALSFARVQHRIPSRQSLLLAIKSLLVGSRITQLTITKFLSFVGMKRQSSIGDILNFIGCTSNYFHRHHLPTLL